MALGRYIKVLGGMEGERSAEQMLAVVQGRVKVIREKRDSVTSITDG